MSSRREFLKTLTFAVLSPLVLREMQAEETKPSRIPLAFSTLGCPAWEWKKILDFATQHGFSAIELRGLEGKLDLPALPSFAPDRMEPVSYTHLDEPPGFAIHEMGTARMGRDPKTSVLNSYNQAHDVKNLFITDGGAMVSSACVLSLIHI